MASLSEIGRPVAEELGEFKRYYASLLRGPAYAMRVVLWYMERASGKQLRPLLVHLCAKAAGGITAITKVAAAMIELVHNASLLHDDVVDNAPVRRGKPSVYKLWGAKGAVLTGDYMLALGLRIAVETGEYALLSIMNAAVQAMSSGELAQLRRTRRGRSDEAGYYEVIRGKTASLFKASCEAGALSAGLVGDSLKPFADYGERLGIAFQIRDDVLDFFPAGVLRKIPGNDIREGKMTLPVLHALERMQAREREAFARLRRKARKDEGACREAVEMVRASGALEQARNDAKRFANAAVEAIAHIPESEAHNAMAELADFIVSWK